MAHPPILIRTLTSTGAQYTRLAQRVAEAAQRAGIPAKYQFVDGYMLRGVRVGKMYAAQVIDLPCFVALVHTDSNGAVPVGTRDEFVHSDQEPMHPFALQNITLYMPEPPRPADAVKANSLVGVPTVWDWHGSMFTLAVRYIPYRSSDGLTSIDSYAAFPAEMVVGISVSMTSFRHRAISDITKLPNNFWALNALWVDEEDLPAGWSMFARRLVSHTVYTRLSDTYRVAYQKYQQFGACARLPTEDDPLLRYAVAFQAVEQIKTLWYDAPDYSTYRPPYYDRWGQRALCIVLGSNDPAAFDVQAEQVQWGKLDSVHLVTIDDLPYPDMKPYPVNYYDAYPDYGRPEVPNWGEFFYPVVLRATEGFVTFSTYRANLGRNVANSECVWSVVIVAPDNTVHALKAGSNWLKFLDDGSYVEFELPGFETYLRYVRGWVIDGFSVDSTDAQGNPVTTAYCLVCENRYDQQNGGASAGYLDGSMVVGSNLALYSFEHGEPTRLELTGTVTSPIAVYSPVQLDFPDGLENNTRKLLTQLSSFAYVGSGYGVTPVVENPHVQQVWYGDYSIPNEVAAHAIKCALINLVTGELEVRGGIIDRTMSYQTCFISVVQPYVPATDDVPAVEAVLLASTDDPQLINSSLPTGAVYLSTDGGWHWTMYNDPQALNRLIGLLGVQFVGNRMWEYDPLRDFTGRRT